MVLIVVFILIATFLKLKEISLEEYNKNKSFICLDDSSMNKINVSI